MGSKGSLHFRNVDQEETVQMILKEYAEAKSPLNSDETHNGHGKPMIVISENWVSVYDGGFAICGDLSEGRYLTTKVPGTALGIANANDDIVTIYVMKEGKDLFSAAVEIIGWLDEVDIQRFQQTLQPPYQEKELEALFAAEDDIMFLERFHKLTDCPFYMDYQWLAQPEEYLELIEETENINVYSKLKPFQWDEDYYMPVYKMFSED